MRFRPRYSLRALFVLVAICAVLMTWGQATTSWIRDRSDALTWINSQPPGIVSAKGYRKGRWRLPWSLWIWGEPADMRYIYLYCSDDCSPADRAKVAELKELFPEADVALKTHSEWQHLFDPEPPP